MARKRRRPHGRGILGLLTLALLASGAIRLGMGMGEAVANAPDAASSEPLVCPPPPVALAEALTAREARLSAQEYALNDRLAALALADKAIEARLAALGETEAKLAATIAMVDGAAESDLARLTSVYEAMKPKDAAPLFEQMAPEFAAGFLGRMKPDVAAAILGGMTADRAYAVTILLASRNAGAPTE
jgi:flagellar motility protein MotE (MotC chaperone)